MLDSLLGRKFSAKCKQSVKCINTRIVLIRKRKQATLNILKNVVAELLANGRDTEALGRMDGLIVELNKISCYDMIERFCECIISHISSLQKQRECPEEEMEAVATLIFAAARFSDLPELIELRHVFISRYGSAMESSVSREFIEKTGTKTFSKDTKLKLMQDIAREFSVSWDYRVFNQKKDHSRKPDLSTQIASQEPATVHKSMDSDTKQEMAVPQIAKKEIPYYGRVQLPVRHLSLKREIKEQPKDVHMTSNPNNVPRVEPLKKTRSDISVYSKGGSVNGVHDTIATVMSNKSDTDDQNKLNFDAASKPLRTTRVRVPDIQGGLKADDDGPTTLAPGFKQKGGLNNEATPSVDYTESMTRHRSHFFPSENQKSKPEIMKEGFDVVGKERHFRELKVDKDIIPPDVNQEALNHRARSVDNHDNGISKSQNQFDSLGPEKQDSVTPRPDRKPRNLIPPYVRSAEADGKVRNMNPPYVKPRAHKPEANVEDLSGPAVMSTQKNWQDLDLRTKADQVYKQESHASKLRPQQDSVDLHASKLRPRQYSVDLHLKENQTYKSEARVEESHGGTKWNPRSQQDLDLRVKEKQADRPDAHVSKTQIQQNFDGNSDFLHKEKAKKLYFPEKEKETNTPEAYVSNIRNQQNIGGLHVIEKPKNMDYHLNEKQDVGDVKPHSGRPPINPAPPYVKPSFKPDKSPKNDIDEFNSEGNKVLPKHELNDIEKPKPRSVRKKYPKPQLVPERRAYADDDEPVNHRRHRQRQPVVLEEDYDTEDMEMDSLLIHLSKKGMSNRSSKSRSKTRTAQNGHFAEVGNHRDQPEVPEISYAPKRAISLPTNRTETTKVPARTPSLQPDMPSPSGARVHPRLPDYDELMAQFNALKRG